MNPKNTLAYTATTAALVVLAWLGTMLIRVPIPATTGYFNLGDIFVILAGLWLGPGAGFIVGLLGPTLADAIGFPQFILATAVTKSCEGLVVGLIGGGERRAIALKWFGAALGAVIMVAGYFTFEAYIYPALGRTMPFFNVTTYADAIVELGPNTLQGVIGVIGGMSLWKLVHGVDPKSRERPENERR